MISVGYRVNSKRATEFRQWATRILIEFSIKGFVLDKFKIDIGCQPQIKSLMQSHFWEAKNRSR